MRAIVKAMNPAKLGWFEEEGAGDFNSDSDSDVARRGLVVEEGVGRARMKRMFVDSAESSLVFFCRDQPSVEFWYLWGR